MPFILDITPCHLHGALLVTETSPESAWEESTYKHEYQETVALLQQAKAAGLGSAGRGRGLGTSSIAFMMGCSSTDSFQVSLREADQEEPEQEGEDQVDLHGCSRWDKVCLKWPLRAGLIHRIKVTAVEHRGKQQKAEVFQENCTPGQRGGSSQSGRSEDWCGYRSVLRACWRSGQSVVGVWQILAERKNGQKTKEKNLMYESENCSL
ncbi:uncharacterized protein LOC113911348 isoform X1 [Zalophus californianus]|uniref:Uncharacterized protein LOC113911348 isoform X1 n=1 Tax=Zalophus californianus TaxID=9704 RepID=A0A6J2BCN4_ZALCA|nr:uncharacterized protein LOC113911348 isoform X1 [Zalophus californianus]XP_027429665.2 uncharacterized protein LOC113911348 isoform X1 [Zalophus californianus]XP_027429666.2 uncharacterized protein LOC113911348 isoform X1 [Zalophus californianus]XP_027429667.2 uncharacterized protein LOC113911348 isoform X1 [Zalophus californianus]XP_027429668.2 uncharacterized protein LOC113911348 isoform X1 [Zalophus californianus]XP_027429669.2 uncharacterized protein LOC113911348 isoform X1 [Zalophus ca